jgi:NitT/TauT family transport system substrate-binding protein
VEAGDPVVILAGGHIGCFELFGTEQVQTIRDLKGKTVAVPDLRTGPITFIASMAAYVGLDPRQDITWVTHPRAEAMQFLAEGKIDAYLGFPPDPQALRAQQIGHVVVNSVVDRPWSQYFCCLVTGNREFVRTYPVATKRVLRAILKAADVCALDPDGAAQSLVDRGYTARYDYARQLMQELPWHLTSAPSDCLQRSLVPRSRFRQRLTPRAQHYTQVTKGPVIRRLCLTAPLRNVLKWT